MPARRRSGATTCATRPRISTGQLDDAKAELGEAFEDLKKVEILEDRERAPSAPLESARDQAAMDQIGLARAMRASA